MLVVVALVLFVAACGGGGSKKVSAASYVTSVCTAMGGFETSSIAVSQQIRTDVTAKLQAAAAKALTNLGTTPNPSAFYGPVKASLVSELGVFAGDAKTLQTKVAAAGVPDIANGSKLAASLDADLGTITKKLDSVEAQAKTVPTNSPTAAAHALNALTGQLQSLGLGSAGSALDSPALDAAAKNAPACEKLANG